MVVLEEIRIYPLGTMNACLKFHGNTSVVVGIFQSALAWLKLHRQLVNIQRAFSSTLKDNTNIFVCYSLFNYKSHVLDIFADNFPNHTTVSFFFFLQF